MSGLSIAQYFPFARVKVMQQTVHGEDAHSAVIKLEPDERWRPRCHDCGRPATIHSRGHVRLHSGLESGRRPGHAAGELPARLVRRLPRRRVEQLSFCDASKRVTHRLAKYVYDLCRKMTVQEVAAHLDLDPKTVKAIDKHFLEQDYRRRPSTAA